MRNIFLILFFFSSTNIFSQTIEKRVVLNDLNDTIIDKVDGLFFSENGEYFYYKNTEEKRLFISTNSSLELTSSKDGIGGIFGKYGEIKTFYTSVDSFYYKNANSIKNYSGGYGKILQHITDFTKDNVALTTEKGDSIYYYLNGTLISVNSKTEIDGFQSTDKWCSFSQNGNTLYYAKQNGIYYLYKNEKVIKTSPEKFIQLIINDNGDYFYGTGKEGIKGTNFDYIFYPNKNNQLYDSVRTIWEQYLKKDGGFYCSGANPIYILINGKYYNRLSYYPQLITIADSVNFLFVEEDKKSLSKKFTLHTQHSSINLGRNNLYKPSMNTKGEYAAFIKGKFRTKVFLNGTVYKKLKGKPISIDSKGNTYSYRKEKGRVFIYYNDSIILKGKYLRTFEPIEFFETFLHDYAFKNRPFFGNRFDYFQIDNKGYIIWDGKLSVPIARIRSNGFGREYPSRGALFCGEIGENEFYLFQYNGEKNIKLIFNNELIDLGNDIDTIITNSIYVRKNEIVFYAICKNKVKRYRIAQ